MNDHYSVLQPRQWNDTKSATLSRLLVILLGLSVAVQIKLGPTLLGSDVLILMTLPLTLYWVFRHPRLISRRVLIIIGLLLLWFLAATFSDIINHTNIFNTIRGLSIIPMFAVAILTLSSFVAGYRDRERLFAISLAFGLLIGQLLRPEWPTFTLIWKFEIGIPISIALTAVLDQREALNRKHLFFEGVALMALGLFSLFWDFRSLAAFLFLMSTIALSKLCFVRGSAAAHPVPQSISLPATVKPILLIALASMTVFGFYHYAVSNGWLGKNAIRRAEAEQATTLGLLLGARPEILISGYAIKKRPLLGYGSWPQNCAYLALFERLKLQYGITTQTPKNACLIPTHSHLFGAWVWAGILAVPVWLYSLFAIGWWCLRAVNDRRFYELLPLLMGAILVWSILFSPFSGRLRITEAFYIAVIFSRYSFVRAKK